MNSQPKYGEKIDLQEKLSLKVSKKCKVLVRTDKNQALGFGKGY